MSVRPSACLSVGFTMSFFFSLGHMQLWLLFYHTKFHFLFACKQDNQLGFITSTIITTTKLVRVHKSLLQYTYIDRLYVHLPLRFLCAFFVGELFVVFSEQWKLHYCASESNSSIMPFFGGKFEKKCACAIIIFSPFSPPQMFFYKLLRQWSCSHELSNFCIYERTIDQMNECEQWESEWVSEWVMILCVVIWHCSCRFQLNGMHMRMRKYITLNSSAVCVLNCRFAIGEIVWNTKRNWNLSLKWHAAHTIVIRS